MTLTSKQIYDGMNPGQRYLVKQFAKRYGVSSASISASLNAMVSLGTVRTERSGGHAVYFVPAPDRTHSLPAMKPWKPSRELMANASRVGELRLYPSKY